MRVMNYEDLTHRARRRLDVLEHAAAAEAVPALRNHAVLRVLMAQPAHRGGGGGGGRGNVAGACRAGKGGRGG
jgi:hypothetical protein